MTAIAPSDELETNMIQCLDTIYDDYSRRLLKPKTTLIILTDGRWQSGPVEEDPIPRTAESIRHLEASGELLDREFTIQLIFFGDDVEGMAVLKYMVDRVTFEACTPFVSLPTTFTYLTLLLE